MQIFPIGVIEQQNVHCDWAGTKRAAAKKASTRQRREVAGALWELDLCVMS
jgi:hypothetical protein